MGDREKLFENQRAVLLEVVKIHQRGCSLKVKTYDALPLPAWGVRLLVTVATDLKDKIGDL